MRENHTGSSEGQDRRKSPRRRWRTLVQIEPSGFQAVTRDISLSGTFVLTAQMTEPGTRVRLTFTTFEPQVQAEGCVRWTRPSSKYRTELAPVGMGIEFVHPAAADKLI